MSAAPLLLLLILPAVLGGPAAHGTPRGVVESIKIDNGLERGDWGNIDICPEGSYAGAFEIKYETTGNIDDTALNGIKLYCMEASGIMTDEVSSIEGNEGTWRGMRGCPAGEFFVGMQANVVPDMASAMDDMGMDNLRMKCSDEQVLDGLYGKPHDDRKVVRHEMHKILNRKVEAVHMRKLRPSGRNTRDLGDWGEWGVCSAGNSVCGLEVRIEQGHLFDDDAGVTDVIMFCCE